MSVKIDVAKLKRDAHHLKAVVLVGQHGVTDPIIAAVKRALKDHELIKVKIAEGPQKPKEAAELLSSQCRAALIQVIGRMVVLFQAQPKPPPKPAPKKPLRAKKAPPPKVKSDVPVESAFEVKKKAKKFWFPSPEEVAEDRRRRKARDDGDAKWKPKE